MSDPVLQINELTVEFPLRKRCLVALDRLSFEIAAGEILGVVGELGAGKSLAGAAVIGLLPRPARIAKGEIRFKGKRIDNLAHKEMRRLRGAAIGTIFQDPLTSLNPLMRIGDQITETIRTHMAVSSGEARDRALSALQEVGIAAAADRLGQYPHQFSGGMRQRIVIALALCCNPSLVIADEPTTALDVSIQAQIINLLKRLTETRGVAVMLVTHDMGVIAETADRVAVIYAGRLAEIGAVRDVLKRPAHPYSLGLMQAIPDFDPLVEKLRQIDGAMPRLGEVPTACAFHPRCSLATDLCRSQRPPMVQIGKSSASCWHMVRK